MQIKFNNKINNVIKILALEAERFGVKIYFVGGLVRDILMGKNPLDIDILVEGNAIDFVKSLDFVQIKSQHKDFGTVKTIIEGTEIDFASTRVEKYPHSGCLPVVTKTGCSIKDDLIRRDFTINAIAARILPSLEYEIIDIFSGAEDIKKGILKVLHKNSYIDDPTRILRGLDFKLRFNFDFSEQDKILIENYLKSPNRECLSKDRVILTLKKLFNSKERANRAFEEFREKKYYKILFDNFDLNAYDINKSVEIFKPQNISETYIKYIFEQEKDCDKLNSRLEIYKYFKNLSDTDICVYYAVTHDENAILYQNTLKNIELKISGSDLINIGFKQGKIIGEILDKTLEAKLAKNSSIKSFLDEINYVKKTFIP